ncbi:MAG: AMP-binding protein, partial [Planctomycetaceae bacterium]
MTAPPLSAATLLDQQDPCLADLFANQVARHPHRPAVSDGAVTSTYAELNVAANRLAHQLIDLGVGPNTLVGI